MKPKQNNKLLAEFLRILHQEADALGGDTDHGEEHTPPPSEAPKASPDARESGRTDATALDTVILPSVVKRNLLAALTQVSHAQTLFQDWGLGETVEYGKGVGILLYGPPGCGKTRVARAIAQYLNRPLVEKSSADVESSIPGAAERAIREAFTHAQNNNAVIFWDECDDLLVSRNTSLIMQWMTGLINEMLRQIERFRGVALFATNRLHALDPAVNRRLALKVEIPRPDQAARMGIWKVHIPDRMPLAKDVNLKALSKIPLTGGEIKNAVLEAARNTLALGEKRVKMRFFVEASQAQINARDAFNEKKNYLEA